MNLDALKAETRHAEGFRERPYRDSLGYWTIGYGHLLPQDLTPEQLAALHWTRDEAEAALDADLAGAIRDAASFPWWRTMDGTRQAVIVELCFNLGRTKFAGFVKTIAAIQNREYAKAGRMLLQSKWAAQVGPTRSGRLAKALERGDEA